MRPDVDLLRALIGGRWAVSWQGYLIGWPLAVLFTFYGAPSLWVSDTEAEGLIRGLVTGTLAYLPVGIVLWLASITVLRGREARPASITLVALVGGLAWTARSITLIVSLQVSGLPSDASPAVRLISGFAQGALATTLAAWLLASTDRFHRRRNAMLRELAEAELAADRLTESIGRMRADVLNTVQRTVDATVNRLDLEIGGAPPSTRTVDALAAASQRVSRVLARELLADAASTARLNPLALIRSAVASRPFAYWGLLPSVVIGLIGLLIYWPTVAAAIALGLVTAFVITISIVANTLTPRLTPRRGMACYVAAVFLLLCTPILMDVVMQALGLDPSNNQALGWSVAVNFGMLYPLIGIGAHIGRAREAVLDRLNDSISEVEVRREALRREKTRLQRELAMSLHGGLQADLTARAMRAQHAIEEGDPASARQALEQARLLMQGAVTLPQSTSGGLEAAVDAVREAWEGLIDVSTVVRVQHEPDIRQVEMIREILLEGIGNAVRHAKARSLDIEISDEAGRLRVMIADDGSGVSDARAGLGFSMFDDMALHGWSLEPRASGGSVLTVTLGMSTATT